MARWQQRARLGLALFAVAFAVALWFLIGERQAPAPTAGVERIDPKAVSEIKGGDVVQLKGATRDIRVEFDTQVLYADGGARYTGFKAFIDDRGGRSFEIRGNEAQVAPEQSAFNVAGDVELRTSDGLTARTPQANFSEADGILRGGGPISFERGRVTGSGVGFVYNREADRLELLDRAVITVVPAADGGGMAVSSGSAAYSRLERFMRFERGMRLERDGQIIEADTSTVFLLPDRDEPSTVELRGQARISGGAGALQAMQARDMNLHYGPDGRSLEEALLVGESRIQLARGDGAPGQQLAADTLNVRLAPDGAVSGLTGRDNVQMTIPATGDAAARAISATTLTASGPAGRGLTQMTFEQNVVYREEAARGGPARTVRARTLNASIGDAGALSRALFSGGFVFDDGTLHAESAEAVYDVAAGTLALRAPAGAPPPTLKDSRFDLKAESIDVTLAPQKLTATGKVSAILAAGARSGDGGASLLNEKEPAVIVCDSLTFDEETGVGRYAGSARVWQQQSGNSIKADTITMNDATGVVTASRNVVTSLPIAGRKEAGAKGNSIARAGEFVFDGAERRARFTEQAQLDGAQGNLRANAIELVLAEGSQSDLQQLIADGTVSVQVEGRQATGQHLVYHPADEKYVLDGTPVRMVQGCQESTGRTLTFYRGSDRISVDGNEETRVQMKGGKCPEPPR